MSDDNNVVPFGKPVAEPVEDNRVWQCNYCGSQSFHLYADGTVECAACEIVGEPGHWHKNVIVAEPPAIDTVAYKPTNFTKASLAKKLNETDDTLAIACFIFDNGRVIEYNNSFDVSDPQTIDWVNKRIEVFRKLVLAEPVPTIQPDKDDR